MAEVKGDRAFTGLGNRINQRGIMVDIRFVDGFPEEMQGTVRELIEKWCPYFCNQVNRIMIRMEEINEAEAAINVNAPYRIANLYLAPGWMNFDADMRERIIVHELAHILVEPMYSVMDFMNEKLLSQGSASQEITKEWFRRSIEGATEDVARAVFKAHTGREIIWSADN